MQYPLPKELTNLLDDVVDMIEELDLNMREIAERAHLSYSTVWKLVRRKTVDPRTSTIMRLCKNCGFSVKLISEYLNKRKSA